MTPDPNREQSVAVLGLGIMGSALARNLIEREFDVRGFDPDSAAAERAANNGVTIAATAFEAAQGTRHILSSLPSESALVLTADSLTSGRRDPATKAVLIELSTLSVESKLESYQHLSKNGIEMLDCPISGTGAQAQSKDIVLYASGNEDAFTSCQPIFDAIARESFFLGGFGNGMRMKLIANLMVAIHNVASAEALALAKKAGLDPQQVFDVISSGAGSSKIFELRGPMMVDETYQPATMKLDVWQKDMALIQDFATKLGAITPLFEATQPLYESAIKLDLGEHDTAAVHKILAQAIEKD
ncbi:MAG: NAD-binding protein [Alphaproteobacteria bacterium]|nr:NAD-binding protein [Alphaproteobacteria bacterium]